MEKLTQFAFVTGGYVFAALLLALALPRKDALRIILAVAAVCSAAIQSAFLFVLVRMWSWGGESNAAGLLIPVVVAAILGLIVILSGKSNTQGKGSDITIRKPDEPI